jgi:hypothetical protein
MDERGYGDISPDEVTLTTSYIDCLNVFPSNVPTDFITLYKDSGGCLGLVDNGSTDWRCALLRVVLRIKSPKKGVKRRQDNSLTILSNIVRPSYHLGSSLPVLNYINFKSGQKVVDTEFTNPLYHKVGLHELSKLRFESNVCGSLTSAAAADEEDCVGDPSEIIENLVLTLHFTRKP